MLKHTPYTEYLIVATQFSVYPTPVHCKMLRHKARKKLTHFFSLPPSIERSHSRDQDLCKFVGTK